LAAASQRVVEDALRQSGLLLAEAASA
jgi:hypothetical protein